MNLTWFFPSFLLSVAQNDVDLTLQTRQSKSFSFPSPTHPPSLNLPLPPNTWQSRTFPPRPSHTLDYVLPLLQSFPSDENLLLSPLSTKLSLLLLALLSDDSHSASIHRFLFRQPSTINRTQEQFQVAVEEVKHFSQITGYSYSFLQSILFVTDYDAIYHRSNEQLVGLLKKAGLLEEIYPLRKGRPSIGDRQRFELFKKATLPLSKSSLDLPTATTLTSLTTFSQFWPAPFYNHGEYRFYLNASIATSAIALHRILANSRYLEAHKATFVSFPYANVKYSFVVALPNINNTVANLLASLAVSGTLQATLNHLDSRSASVKLTWPKFTMKATINQTSFLANTFGGKQAALDKLFTQFTVNLADLEQKVAISVNEFGTSFETLSSPYEAFYVNPTAELLIDRPFLYFVTGKFPNVAKHEVLFAGIVCNPN